MPTTEPRQQRTIKSMPDRAWERAHRHSRMSGETLADWLARAIDQLAERELSAGGDPVLPPGVPGPTGIPPGIPGSPEATTAALRQVEATFRAALAASEASGVPVPKTTARHCFALLTSTLRAARGLPPVLPRGASGHTEARIGHTA